MKKSYMLFMFVLAFIFSGCQTPPEQPVDPSVKVLKDINLGDKSKQIETSTEVIDKAVPNNPVVQTETGKLNAVATALKEDDKTVQDYKNQIKSLLEQIALKNREIERLKSESAKAFNNMLAYGMYLGGIFILFGVVGIVIGTKIPMAGGIGVAALAAGVSLIVIDYVLMTQMMWFVPIGVVIVLGVLGYAIYSGIKHSKETFNKDEALTDLTKTIEIIKHHVGDETWGEVKDLVGKIQKPTTQAIVSEKKALEINTKYSANLLKK